MAKNTGNRFFSSLGTAVVLAVLLSACAGQADREGRPAVSSEAASGTNQTYTQTGKASWYGKKYHGRTTASGEAFDMNALTAAHRTLPFGTIVRVTSLSNGRSITVRINDRGPFVQGRVIDLSRQAASELGFIDQGVIQVRLEVIG